MRNRLLLLALLCTSILYSCSKDSSPAPVTNNVNNGNDTNKTQPTAFDFIVNGVSDVSVDRNSMAALPISVEYKAGTQEAVTLSVSGLPAGVTDSFYAKSGTPTFASALMLTTVNAKPGTSQITLNAKSASGISKDYKFNLNITGAVDCRDDIVGTYNVTNSCEASMSKIVISKDPDNSTILRFEKFPMGLSYTKVTVDCGKGTLSVPFNYFGINGQQYTMTATGAFSANAFTLDYTLNDNTHCTLTGTK